ncbi:MAG: hypothetical protein ACFFAU_01435 [Candidatus Hodarchaeota archaeon]
MSKRLDVIKQIQEVQKEFTKITNKLFEIIKDRPPDDFKKMVVDYLMTQGKLNTDFSMSLFEFIPKEIDKDKFDEIMKSLKKDLDKE